MTHILKHNLLLAKFMNISQISI